MNAQQGNGEWGVGSGVVKLLEKRSSSTVDYDKSYKSIAIA
ncbi:hypothetical protein [Nostoc sp.]